MTEGPWWQRAVTYEIYGIGPEREPTGRVVPPDVAALERHAGPLERFRRRLEVSRGRAPGLLHQHVLAGCGERPHHARRLAVRQAEERMAKMEAELAEALAAGIQDPRMRVDSAGVVVISGETLESE